MKTSYLKGLDAPLDSVARKSFGVKGGASFSCQPYGWVQEPGGRRLCIGVNLLHI
jgi:hypothetical protein